MLRRAALLLVVSACLVLPADGQAAAGDPFDSGATGQLMAAAPATLRWAPDGRVFVALKSGIINVYDSIDDPTPTVYADLRTNVDDFLDRGLLGLAVDPGFTQG